MSSPDYMTHYVGDNCGHMNDGYLAAANERAEQAEARVRRLEAALRDLAHAYREPCWCGVAIGNPMYKQHSQPCVDARAALADAQGEGNAPGKEDSDVLEA